MDERVLTAARRYAEERFPVEGVDAAIEDAGLALGPGRESWLVRVQWGATLLVVAVEVDEGGRCEAIHHVRLAA